MSRRSRALLLALGTAALSLCLVLLLGLAFFRRDEVTLRLLHPGRELSLGLPRALLLLALLPWVWLGGAASLTDMSRAQRIVQAAVRSVLLLCLCLALSRPSLLGQRQTVSAVALCDVSDSMTQRQVAAATAFVEDLRLQAAARGAELHVLRFASRPEVMPLLPVGPAGPPGAAPSIQLGGDGAKALDGGASDLQAALQLAYGLFSPGTLRRAVFLSDGNQTKGDLLGEAQAARRRGVRLHHVSVQAEKEDEVLVRELRVAYDGGGEKGEAEIKVGAPFTLEAEVYASAPQRVRATLYRDGAEDPGDGRRDVELGPGKNLLRFRSEVATAGSVGYRLQLSAPGPAPLQDRFAGNNAALLSLSIKGRPHVLYIEGEPAAAGYLSRALTRENIDVEVRNPYGLPAAPRDLARFDLVILSDTSSTLVGQAQMAAIEGYVRDLGGGFVMTGGENSFGSGGYQGTILERVLPVRFEQERKRDQPSLALVLCIDRSGSMNGPKLELAKEAAKATASLLASDDLIGVVAFDSQATPLVRLQPARNRIRIESDIARLQAGGGTQILPPLQEAYQQLLLASAKLKHVILLTDGQAEYQGILELVDQMVEHKITISAVGVGAGADQTLLTQIAEHGGGRFYFTQDATSIPKIFTKETTQVARSALVEDAVRVVVQKRVELLDGTGIESAPPLRGYVATKAKPLSETILSSNLGEPILVRWRHGLGQAVAFTSDVKNRWAVDWLRWPGYGRLFAQLVRSAMRQDPRTRGHGYDLSATASPPDVHVVVDAVSSEDRFVSGLDTTLQVLAQGPGGAGPRRAVASAPMQQTAPGRYEADVRVPGYGAFLLRAIHRSVAGGPVVAESWGSLPLSYPREYLALPPDLVLLGRASAVAGGRKVSAAAEVLDPGEERVPFLRPLWPYLAGLSALLLLLDVALRRVRLFGYRPLSL